jgi:hypothetical protein
VGSISLRGVMPREGGAPSNPGFTGVTQVLIK